MSKYEQIHIDHFWEYLDNRFPNPTDDMDEDTAEEAEMLRSSLEDRIDGYYHNASALHKLLYDETGVVYGNGMEFRNYVSRAFQDFCFLMDMDLQLDFFGEINSDFIVETAKQVIELNDIQKYTTTDRVKNMELLLDDIHTYLTEQGEDEYDDVPFYG